MACFSGYACHFVASTSPLFVIYANTPYLIMTDAGRQTLLWNKKTFAKKMQVLSRNGNHPSGISKTQQSTRYQPGKADKTNQM